MLSDGLYCWRFGDTAAIFKVEYPIILLIRNLHKKKYVSEGDDTRRGNIGKLSSS
jgi:hypothetical protein